MERDHNPAREGSTSGEIPGISLFSVDIHNLLDSFFLFFLLSRLFCNVYTSQPCTPAFDGMGTRRMKVTHPPYFNTVISGIAAPKGKLLLVSFLIDTLSR
jgi:hypothetical protein